MEKDPFDLNRFVTAQESVFETALAELRAGRKQGHWIWFIFPQLRALGRSSTANFYGIENQAEVEAYLAHPVLADRLATATEAVLDVPSRSAFDIFGAPDNVKFRSSMTLFAVATDSQQSPFHRALELYFAGVPDELTLDMLAR